MILAAKRVNIGIGPECDIQIRWLHARASLPDNVLLRLRHPDDEKLFIRAHGRIIRLAVVATVASQADFTRRVRTGGGAHDLAKRGVVVLGQLLNTRTPSLGSLEAPKTPELDPGGTLVRSLLINARRKSA